MNESRLLSFMTKNEEYAVHLLEGQKIIKDLALIHNLKGEGFLFYRDCVLSSLPLISLLKHGETLGHYIDSQEPKFSFKIEMSEHGDFRTLMMPESFTDFPKEISGHGRLTKIAKGKNPYNSIIELKSSSLADISNQMINESYQMEGHILLSDDSDQAALIMKLPRKSWDKNEVLPTTMPLADFIASFQKMMPALFNAGQNDEQQIIKAMEKHDYFFLKGKDVAFKCSCSRERMIQGIASLLSQYTVDELFQGQPSLETKCDYCHTYYEITQDECLAQ